MQSTLARLGAALLGAFLLLVALIGSFGTVLLVPIGMFVAGRLARRRGRDLTMFEKWTSGVIPFGAVVIIGLATAALVNPHGWFEQMQSIYTTAQQHPPEQPAWLRQLGAPPPAPLPPAVAKPLGVVTALIGLEFWAAFVGTIAWGATSLLAFGLRGGRSAGSAATLASPA